ncbi:karyopherin [Coemansia guatemalensis]|uniref:Karyopherin n=1 Tax=Coemansia guatemalensis TaxID=2761395 RepID=A0A9W8I3S7_9FUNG|nr:karyopherin [Coemansia guatemalensis]
MDREVLQRAVQALELVYNSNTPADERKAAESFCEQLKREERAADYGHYLATRANGYAAEVRHFGVQLIEETLRQRWTAGKGGKGSKKKAAGVAKLTAEESFRVRDMIWELLVTGGADEAAFVREKEIAVMVMAIVRLWPSEEWTNLSAQLQHLSANGGSEVVQGVWQRLGEEVFVYERDAAAQVRKHELTNGLVGALLPRQVVRELYPNGVRLSSAAAQAENGEKAKKAGLIVEEAGFEEGWVQWWLQEAQALAGSDDGAERLLQVTQTVAAYVDWMPLRAMAAVGLVPRVAGLLQARSNAVRQQAAEVLERIAQRGAGSEDDAVLQQFAEHRGGEALAAIAQAYGSTVGGRADAEWDDADDALEAARTLAHMCARLVTQHWARSAAVSADAQARLVELLAALARDSRHSVAAPALAAWAVVARNAALRATPAVAAALSGVAEQTTTALVATSRAAQRLGAGASAEAAGLDAGEAAQLGAAEARALLGEARTRQLGVLRALSEADPAGFVAWLAPALDAALAQPDEAAADAALAAAAAVFGALDDAEQRALRDGDTAAVEQLSRARVTCYALGRRVAEFDGGAATAVRQLQTLPALAFLLRPAAMAAQSEARELLVALVRRCAAIVREPGPVARRATAALVRVAVAVPDSLMLVYADVAALVQEMLEDAAVSGTVKGYLREFQLAIVAGAEGCSLSRRAELALPLLRPLVDALRTASPALQSPAAFIAMLWRSPDCVDPAAEAQAARRRRDELARVLSTLLICLGRTLGDGATHLAPLWGDLASELVPPLQQLVRCLHALWNPEHWRGLPQDAQAALDGVLEMTEAERHAIAGVVDEQPSQPTSHDPLLAENHAVRHSLAVLREHAYSCLGRLARLPAAPIEPGMVLADLEHMAPRHWRALLTNVATPVLASLGNWPGFPAADSAAASIEAWLVPLAVVCVRRLDAEWLTIEQTAPISADHSLDAAAEEIVRERAVRMWTRAWGRLVCELLEGCAVTDAARLESELTSAKVRASSGAAGDTSASTSAAHGNPVLGRQLLGSDLFADVLGAAVGVLRYPDTAAARLVLARLAELAPSLAIVALLPLHCPPTPALASVANALLERIKCARPASDGACSPLFGWVATELVPALLRVLASPRLIDCQEVTLGILADVFHASAVFARISTHWPRRYSSGDADQLSPQTAGDPGHIFRQTSLRAMTPVLQSAEVSADDVENALESAATTSESRRRRALLKMALMPLLAVEQARQFANPKDHSHRNHLRSFEESGITRAAPADWTNKLAGGATASVLDNDSEFDLATLMP